MEGPNGATSQALCTPCTRASAHHVPSGSEPRLPMWAPPDGRELGRVKPAWSPFLRDEAPDPLNCARAQALVPLAPRAAPPPTASPSKTQDRSPGLRTSSPVSSSLVLEMQLRWQTLPRWPRRIVPLWALRGPLLPGGRVCAAGTGLASPPPPISPAWCRGSPGTGHWRPPPPARARFLDAQQSRGPTRRLSREGPAGSAAWLPVLCPLLAQPGPASPL